MGNQDSKPTSTKNKRFSREGNDAKDLSTRKVSKTYRPTDETKAEGTTVDITNEPPNIEQEPELRSKLSGLPGEVSNQSKSKDDEIHLLSIIGETDNLEEEETCPETPVEFTAHLNCSVDGDSELKFAESSNLTSPDVTDPGIRNTQLTSLYADIEAIGAKKLIDASRIDDSHTKITSMIESDDINKKDVNENNEFESKEKRTLSDLNTRANTTATNVEVFPEDEAKYSDTVLFSPLETAMAIGRSDTLEVSSERNLEIKDVRNTFDGNGDKKLNAKVSTNLHKTNQIYRKQARSPSLDKVQHEISMDRSNFEGDVYVPAHEHAIDFDKKGVFRRKGTLVLNDNRTRYLYTLDDTCNKNVYGIYSNVMFLPDKSKGASPKRYGPKRLGAIMPTLDDIEGEDSDSPSEGAKSIRLKDYQNDDKDEPDHKTRNVPSVSTSDLSQMSSLQENTDFEIFENGIDFVEDHFALHTGSEASGFMKSASQCTEDSLVEGGDDCEIPNSTDIEPKVVCFIDQPTVYTKQSLTDLEHADIPKFPSDGIIQKTSDDRSTSVSAATLRTYENSWVVEDSHVFQDQLKCQNLERTPVDLDLGTRSGISTKSADTSSGSQGERSHLVSNLDLGKSIQVSRDNRSPSGSSIDESILGGDGEHGLPNDKSNLRNSYQTVSFPTFRQHYKCKINWDTLKSPQGKFARKLKSRHTSIAEDNRMSLEFCFPFYAGILENGGYSSESCLPEFCKQIQSRSLPPSIGSHESIVNDLDVASDENDSNIENGDTDLFRINIIESEMEENSTLEHTTAVYQSFKSQNGGDDRSTLNVEECTNEHADKDRRSKEIHQQMCNINNPNMSPTKMHSPVPQGNVANPGVKIMKEYADIDKEINSLTLTDDYMKHCLHQDKNQIDDIHENEATVPYHGTIHENEANVPDHGTIHENEATVPYHGTIHENEANVPDQLDDHVSGNRVLLSNDEVEPKIEYYSVASNGHGVHFKRKKTKLEEDNRLLSTESDDEEDLPKEDKKSTNDFQRSGERINERETKTNANGAPEGKPSMFEPLDFSSFLSEYSGMMTQPPHIFARHLEEHQRRVAKMLGLDGLEVSDPIRKRRLRHSVSKKSTPTNKNQTGGVKRDNAGSLAGDTPRSQNDTTRDGQVPDIDSDSDSSVTSVPSVEVESDEDANEPFAVLVDANWDAVIKLETIKCRQATPSPAKHRCTVLCIDISGSMMGAPWLQMKEALQTFVKGIEDIKLKYGTTELVSMVTFGHETKVALTPTTDYSQVMMTFDKLEAKGNSPLEPVLFLALFPVIVSSNERYQYNLYGQYVRHRMILLTDCHPTPHKMFSDNDNVTDRQETEAAQAVLAKMKNLNGQHLRNLLNIQCVPIGANPNMELMEIIAKKSGGHIIPVTDMHRLCTNTHNYLNSLQIASHVIDSDIDTLDENALTSIISTLDPDIGSDDVSQMIAEIRFEFKKDRRHKKKQAKTFSGVPAGAEDNDTDSDVESDDGSRPSGSENDSFLEVEGMPAIGTRVKRAPDFDSDEIVGVSEKGTITGHSAKNKKRLFVMWDCGIKTYCRYGSNDKYDVVIDDVSHIPCKIEDSIRVGYKVRRGPDWQYGNQDGGSDQLGTVYNVYQNGVEIQVRWHNGNVGRYRYNYDGAYDVLISNPEDPFDAQRYTHEMNRRNFAKTRGIDINSAVHYRHERLEIDLTESLFGLDPREAKTSQSRVNKNAFRHRPVGNVDRSSASAIPNTLPLPLDTH